MAVTANHLDSGHADSVSSQATASKTPGAKRLQLLFVVNGFGGTPNTPTVTGCGLTWVQVVTNTRFTNYRTTLFRAMGTAPTTGTLTIDYGGQTQSFNRYFWDEFDGVKATGTNGADAVIQTVYNPSSGNGSVTLAAFSHPSNATYGAIFYNTTTTALTPGSGFTELGVYIDATNGDGSEVEWKDVNDTSVDWSVAGSTFNYMAYGIEIAAPTGGSSIPNGYDDFGDTTITAGNASSGWNVASNYTFTPFNSFPELYGAAQLFALCPVPVALSLDGTGSLVSALNGDVNVAMNLDGVGNLAATLGSDFTVAVSMNGLGDLLASINSDYAIAVGLNGSGSLVGDMNQDYAILVSLDGTGELTGDMNQDFSVNVALDGSGGLTGDMNQSYAIAVPLDGSGSLTADLGQDYAVHAALGGSGGLSGNLGEDFTMTASLTGQGELVIPSLGGDFSMDTLLSGEGDLVIHDLGGDFTMVVTADGHGGLTALIKKKYAADDSDVLGVGLLTRGGVEADKDVWSIL